MPQLVQKNGVIKSLTPLRRRPFWQWHTVWPFFIIYAVQAVLYSDPELVWGKVTYLIWQKYIDFFHTTSWPVLFFIHAFVALFTVWSVKMKARLLFTTVGIAAATHVFVETMPHKGEPQVIPLLRAPDTGELHFIFQQRKWKFDAAERKVFQKPHFPTKHTFAEYAKRREGLSITQVAESCDAFGENRVVIRIPEFMELFVDHALAPFFVFQMFCVLLWCLDEYWMYSLFTGAMMVVLECTVVTQRINNMKSLRSMGNIPVSDVEVFRAGKKLLVKSTELVPLDVISIPMNRPAPADILIISGGCVVNEAMLTGESTPQMKECIDTNSDMTLQMKRHMRHIVFSGTEVLTSTPGQRDYGKVAATGIVLKTGFETKQGKLLRTIIHSQSRVSQNSGEAFAFIGFLLCFALMAVGYLLKRGLADPTRSRWKLVLHTTQIITAVVPPELPMELSLAVNSSLMQLVKLRVFCTEPFRIPFAGKVDTCCFDKTGTLTTDEMVFAGIDPCDGRGIRSKLQEVPPGAEAALAGCHTLVHLDGDLAGDAMEKAAVKALGYKWTKDDTFNSSDDKTHVTIITRFPFDPDLRRMSCVVNSGSSKLVVVKGSPESIVSLCKDSTVPNDYQQLVEAYTGKGLRVIALATKSVTMSKSEIANLTREQAEKELVFEGLAIFQCPLKRDTIETIRHLTNGSHRCCIITGDNIHTALAVGKEVGMIIGKTQLLAVPAREGGDGMEWEVIHDAKVDGAQASITNRQILSADEVRKAKVVTPELLKRIGVRIAKFSARDKARREAVEFDLCVNAETLSSKQFAEAVGQFGDLVTIWARCAPAQKEDIVAALKAKGRVVLMAGDGTNDVGGLKQAQVGVAVLNSAAVVASQKAAQQSGIVTTTGHPQPPPEPGPNAGMMERARYEVARMQHQAQLIQRKRIDAKGDPDKFEVVPMPPPPGPRAGWAEMARYNALKQQHQRETAIKKQMIAAKASGKPDMALANAGTTTANDDDDLVGSPAGLNPLGLPLDGDFFSSSLFNAEEMEDGRSAPITKLGDASIAAPFTCKSKKMMALCDLVRLGRSTLVTTLQMYKILALNCLVSAYSMSVLHSDGVKLGDYQMVVTGIVLSICFLCMNFSKPLPTLSAQRPITRVFHPYMVCSILGQFGVHLFSIVSSVNLVAAVDSAAIEEQRSNVDNADFKPSLLNSIVFLMTTLMTAVTFAVNFKGEPFMQPMRKNKVFFYSLIGLTFLIFYLASEVDPETNEMLEVVKFPSDEFRASFLQLLVTDAIGAFLVERVCLFALTDLR